MNGDDERLKEEGNGAEKGTCGEEGGIGRLFCRIDSHSKRCSVMNMVFLITSFPFLFIDFLVPAFLASALRFLTLA